MTLKRCRIKGKMGYNRLEMEGNIWKKKSVELRQERGIEKRRCLKSMNPNRMREWKKNSNK